jgi:LAS superfamily LD-carboxypeptidase LdcB
VIDLAAKLISLGIDDFLIHPDVYDAFWNLSSDASDAGFELAVTSSFRSFDRQISIWNTKARGERAILDDNGEPLNYSELSPKEIVFSILRWSALPGLSRHHWGSDIDVYDRLALPTSDYQVELTPEEVAAEGIFGPFHQWLSEKIKNNESHGFYRPYAADLGGIAPEMWHLSFEPVAREKFLELARLEDFLKSLNSSLYEKLELREIVIAHAEEIHERFFLRVSPPAWI